MNAEDIASSQNAQNPWLCYDCNPPGSQTQRVSSAVPVSRTHSSSSDGWQVVEKLVGHGLQEDEYFGTKADVLKLVTRWDPITGQVQPDTAEPFFLVELAEVAKEYFQDWQGFPEYVQKDADDLAGNPYFEDLLHGYRHVKERVAQEVHDHSAVKKMNMGLSNVEAELHEMLLSVPYAVMHGICGASLRSRKASDADMYAWLVNNYIQSEGRPCIYMLELTDQIGRAPTLEDTRKIVSEARRYMDPDGSESDEKLAIRVDSVRHPSTEDEVRDSKTQGWRFYLRSDDARKHPKALLDELEKELDTRSQGGHASDKPMPWALRDVGYTHNGPSRLKAQEKLSSAANRIMGLFSAIAESHPDFIARQKKQLEDDQTVQPAKYQAHGEVIFLCFRHTHAALAECMFSVLARSYSKWGRGFNTVEAGQSIASNKQYDLLEF
jgi:hypothetical protein